MKRHSSLREANAARQKEWDTGGKLSLSFKGNELAGELGETIEAVLDLLGYSAVIASAGGRASNIVKKLEREQLGIKGSRATNQDLANELADIIICADLLALYRDIDLQKAVVDKFNVVSEKMNLKTRMVY